MFNSEFECWMWRCIVDEGYYGPDELLDYGRMLMMGGEL